MQEYWPTEPRSHHLDLWAPGTGSAINRISISLGCSYSSSQMMTGSPTLIRPNALHVELSAAKNGKSRYGDERSYRKRYASWRTVRCENFGQPI